MKQSNFATLLLPYQSTLANCNRQRQRLHYQTNNRKVSNRYSDDVTDSKDKDSIVCKKGAELQQGKRTLCMMTTTSPQLAVINKVNIKYLFVPITSIVAQ